MFLIISLISLDWLYPLPLPQEDATRVVLAADGTPLWKFTNKEQVWRYPVTIKQVSPFYIQLLLTYEDRWFYHHPGINLLSLVRAVWQDVYNHHIVSGGSTLSMQVARIIDPCPRDYIGKIRQIMRAFQLEWHLDKDQILTLYLNHVSYGGTIEGIAAASWSYLGKPPDQLTRGEAALLAVLPQAPSRLRPDRYPEQAKKARDKVLDRMVALQEWPADEVKEIKEENVLLSQRQTLQIAPLLARRLYNYDKEAVIHSTLDITMQRRLEALLSGWQHKLPPHSSAAILVVDHETMAVKAYLGSINFQDWQRFGNVDMVSAVRSPGSTLKPFLYGLAMDDGLINSASLLQDIPRRYGDYRPGDFSSSFIGPVSAADALTASLNLPAVQLLEAYGAGKFYEKLNAVDMQLRLPAGVKPNLAIILGGTGTSLEKLVMGYSAFAREGRVAHLRYEPGEKLEEKRLLSPGAAWIIRHILMGGRPVKHGWQDTVILQKGLAWKTGTSYGFRDAWAIGINDHYLIGVWIGRPDGTPVAGQYGVASALPLLYHVHDILKNQGHKGTGFVIKDHMPSSVRVAEICWPSGQALSAQDTNCRQRHLAWVLDDTLPPTLEVNNSMPAMGISQTIWVNSKGLRVASDCPGAQEKRVDFWPVGLEPWLPVSEHHDQIMPANDTACPFFSRSQRSSLVIVGVRTGDRLRRPEMMTHPLTLNLSSLGGTRKQWWFLNGVLIQETVGNQAFNYRFEHLGRQQLTVLDETGQTASADFSVY